MPYLIFPPLFLNPEYTFLSQDWRTAERALLLGVTLAAYPIGQFLGSPILGALSDDYGRKPLLTSSLLVSAVCYLLSSIALYYHQLLLLILTRLGAGLMEGNIAIARAFAADLKLLSKQRTFGRINAATSIAYLIGPLLGGILTDKNLFSELTISTPFYLISILFVLLSFLTGFVLKKGSALKPREIRSFWQRINLVKRLSLLFQNRSLKSLMIASTIFTLAVDIFYEFAPVYLTVKWTLVPSHLTIYNGVLCIGLTIGSGWLASFLATRRPGKTPIFAGIIGFSLFLLGIVWANNGVLMLAFFGICGLAIGLATTLITVKLSDSASDAIQGEVMGTQISLRVLGDGIICLLGGALLILSPRIILVAAAAISPMALLYFQILSSRKS